MPTPSRNLSIVVLLLFALLTSPESAFAKETKLRIVGTALVWGGSCEPGSLKILAGSRYFLRVMIMPDTTLQPLTPGWPEGYVLEAALDLPYNAPFIPTPNLIEQLQPERIIDQLNRSAEGDFLQHHPAFWQYENLNAKNFMLIIPSHLSGHTLTFRAHFQSEKLSLISNATNPITIIAPCDRSDTARIVATRVYEAIELGNSLRVMELADSMLSAGLSEASVWTFAREIARAYKRYEKALIYLDRIYEDFGVLGTSLNTVTLQYNPNGQRSQEKQEAYQNWRTMLLQEKAEYEQQQQK